MAAVDSFQLLYRQIARTCNTYIEALAIVGAWYVTRKSICFICDFYNMVRLHFVPRLVSRRDLMKHFGKWALVTGGTDGIGKAYAEELACQGINLILISHDRSKLEATATAISDTFNVETIIIEADFTRGREIYQPIQEALKDKEIGILVNGVNVPFEHPQSFLNMSEDKLWDLINVNIAATNMMIHILLPGMIERKKGAIVNISSGSSCKPTPQMAMYSSTKMYLDHFSRALHFECAPKGIFVQSLLPFHVKTNTVMRTDGFSINSWLAPSANVYAHHAVSTLGVSHRTSGYWMHSIQFLFAQYMPEWLWVWGVTLMNNRLCRKAAHES
ncbi:inactive hydroxysteroid dehydrogenase-like protein 1 [Rhincodon typus]|uniref:inactive hydroxysteroid dehydrogenase-like protein 1 n=1 Tax=Rhincodon typus TaxID=259920 RepID=UPI00202EDCFF|nr:inactive hydroxysteroid dehydrogenase-like protein 1 [Rhincodon typus]XP_048452548.1 inactive hydroxysteroid dehydrogenase-like protein 1 [Rhincodon typus]